MTKAEQFHRAQNKFAAYDAETERLVQTATELQKTMPDSQISLQEITRALRNSFKKNETHRDVLLHDMYTYRDPSHGFCTSSGYLIYTMTGGDKVWEFRRNRLHWWLYHKASGTEFDIAHSQFDDNMLNNIYKNWESATDFLKQNEPLHMQLEHMAHKLADCAGLGKHAKTRTIDFTGHDI